MTDDVTAPEAQAPAPAVSSPPVNARKESRPFIASFAGRSIVRPLQLMTAAGLIAMIGALLLPWTTVRGTGEALSQYGAPTPSVASWLLIAIGLATGLVSAGVWVAGTHRSPVFLLLGSLMYFAGSCLWYFSTIYPGVVAAGCNAAGGPLCNSPAANPVVSHSSIASGLILGMTGSLLVAFTVVIIIWRAGSVHGTSAD